MVQQSALGFLESQVRTIEPGVYRRQYPFIQYPRLVPVDTSAQDWTRGVVHYSSDQSGEAQWFGAGSTDMANASVTYDQHLVRVEMAGIGYSYNLEEIQQAMMASVNLTNDKAMASRRASEEFIDKIVLNGNSDISPSWDGLTNQASTVVTTVTAANGAGGTATWASKTDKEIIEDVIVAISRVYEDSLQVEIPNTIALPVSAYTQIASQYVGDNAQRTILEYIRENNVYTAVTGQPLMITTIRGLENAGSSNTGRMIAYSRDPDVLKLHLPMPYRFFPPMQTGPMMFQIPGAFRLGGLEIRRPKAILYVDGITS